MNVEQSEHISNAHEMKILTVLRGIIYNTNMSQFGIVIDTNVLVAALRSNRGASHKLLLLIDSGLFDICVSVPLVLEYEAVVKRQIKDTALTEDDMEAILDYICAVAQSKKIHYLWRPNLPDPDDDMVLELAVAAGCTYIVTFNIQDFVEAEGFGVKIVTPKEFLKIIGAWS